MPTLFSFAEQVLTTADVDTKLSLTQQAWQHHQRGELNLAIDPTAPLPIDAARFPGRPILVDPRELPKRKLNSTEGKVALLHAVAHIEFSAIQLAWDHLYRFREMPMPYFVDWLGVAVEEEQHFAMLRGRLRELGADYGDLPAHAGLWGIAADTAYDVLARMALVPRFMEARGLDVTPGMITRLQNASDAASVNILERILHDEVGHVALGSRWFQWVCGQRGLQAEAEYFKLIDRHMHSQVRGPFNRELRLQAGFSEAELLLLQQFSF
jgi:uncharacterized ferritin-like protein (DUF455 family)